MIISIIDGDALLHMGSSANFSKGFKYHNFPTGGIFMLMRELLNRSRNGEDIIVCFDSKTDRRETASYYKANRASNPSVKIQKDIIIPMLEKAGFHVEKRIGYEADDLIYSACMHNYSKYDMINIVSVDYDLLYTLDVKGKVCFRNANVNRPDVNVANYSSVVEGLSSTKNVKVPFGAYTAYKVFLGDVSDNIPALTDASVSKKLYDSAVAIALNVSKDGTARLLNNKDVAIKIFEKSMEFEGVFFDVRKVADLVYPKKCEDSSLVYQDVKINREALANILNLFGMKKNLKTEKLSERPLTQEEILFLESKAEELRTGVANADSGFVSETDVFSKDNISAGLGGADDDDELYY